MKLIVGLGNPGEKYLGTRHNLGFTVLDMFVTKILPIKESEKFWKVEKKFKSEIGKVEIKGEEVMLIKPQTYMNNSGMALSLIKNYFKISPEDIIIIHDDLDLPLGKIKVRLGGAAAGHHGVESVMKELGTDQFVRLRLGIGVSFMAEKFVLDTFTSNEKPKLKHMIKQAIEALDLVLKEGVEVAQNSFN